MSLKKNTISVILKEVIHLVRKNIIVLAVYGSLSVAIYAYMEIIDYHSLIYYLIVLTDLILNFLLTIIILRSVGYSFTLSIDKFFGYIVLVILITIITIAGAFLLLLPGLYAMTRWISVYGKYLTGSLGIRDSMQWSWDSTRNLQSSIFVILVIFLLPAFISFSLTIFSPQIFRLSEVSEVIVANLLSTFSYIAIIILGLAVFKLVSQQERDPT